MRHAPVLLGAIILLSCGDDKKPAPPAEAKKQIMVVIRDESIRFPKTDLVEVKVEPQLMGKAFLGGGNIGHYKRGKLEYDLFLAKSTGGEASALVLFDYKNALTGAKLIPHFGGYFGKDGDKEVFVFSKGPWIAGVSGLSEKDADLVARDFAARLPAN